MRILLLPGYSLKNKEEKDILKSALESAGYKVVDHEWPQWQQPDAIWNEESQIDQILAKCNEPDEYILVAKSIGSTLGVKMVAERGFNFKAILFLGAPIGDYSEEELARYKENLKKIKVPLTVIQNKSDNHGGSDLLRNVYDGITYTLIEKDAADHRYNYPEDVVGVVRNFGDTK